MAAFGLTKGFKTAEVNNSANVNIKGSSVLDRKIKLWKERLLDLSKRNRMINYRDTKRSTLNIQAPAYDELFVRLVLREEELTFQSPIDRASDFRAFAMLSLLESLSCPLQVLIGDIKTDGSILERQKTLKNLREKAKLAKEEQGTNILYMCFGFIEWKESNAPDEQWIKSPLVMVPVSLLTSHINAPFKLSRHEDEIEVNPTLAYRFKKDYKFDLPDFDVNSQSIIKYMDTVEKEVNNKGWRLSRSVSIGLLSFLKINMYYDLDNHYSRILANPVLCAMSGDAAVANIIPDEYKNIKIDDISPDDCYQALSADSSQQEAVLLSKSGVSFVMQGPPGTGKSQTITNIIAEALASGKKILFVSEKAAALQVVQKRLSEVKLDDFCLNLHSHKANKKEILNEIGANLKLERQKLKESALAELTELFYDRAFLNSYAQELHEEVSPFGESLYSCFIKAAEHDAATRLPFKIGAISDISEREWAAMCYAVSNYEKALNSVNFKLSENPWYLSTVRVTNQAFQEDFMSRTATLENNICLLEATLKQTDDVLNVKSAQTFSDADLAEKKLEAVQKLLYIPEKWLDSETLLRDKREALKAGFYQKSYFDSHRKLIQILDERAIDEIDIDNSISSIERTVSDIKGMDIYKTYTEADVLDNAVNIKAELEGIISGTTKLLEKYKLLQSVMQYNEEPCIRSINTLSAIVKEAISGNPVKAEWFDKAFISQCKQLLYAGRAKTAYINEHEQVLFSNWEMAVFDIDTDSMLARFKTDYTGFFRFFKSAYRADVRTIKALSKTIIKKIHDEDIVQLLQDVRTIKDGHEWFQANSYTLERSFGRFYIGERTAWDDIDAGIKSVERITSLYPAGIVPEEVIDIICNRSANINAWENIVSLYDGFAAEDIQRAGVAMAKFFGVQPDDNIGLAPLLEKAALCIESIEQLLSLQSDLAIYTKKELSAGSLLDGLNLALTTKKHRGNLDELSGHLSNIFEGGYSGLETNWDSILKDINYTKNILKAYDLGIGDNGLLEAIRNDKKFRDSMAINADKVQSIMKELRPQVEYYSTLFSDELKLKNVPLSSLAAHCKSCRENYALLDKWIDCTDTREACDKLGLSSFTSAVADADNNVQDVLNAFKKGFYTQWIEVVLPSKKSLRQFRRRTHDEKIARFTELDSKQLAIAQIRIREKIINTFPDSSRFSIATDEMSILKQELNKRRGTMPLRKLFRKIPNLLLRLKPCLMMSPLSVSYFLEADSYQFDMVIFDEASQIFPQDAIGAIFRGSQIIITGDSKQLPPTNFFAVSTGNDDDHDSDDDDEDENNDVIYDSILEETANVLPNKTLRWHYRSKHEHLIAFSNKEFYENSLITFPSAIEKEADSGVDFIYVKDGVYEGGGKNCNMPEAQRCVELVREHINKHPSRSLGIVAFSEKQQQAISLEIQKFREQNPKFEEFFKEGKEEEFFVKNLENVQGDERDTIFFSVCYAKTKEQKLNDKPMAMRFGPLGVQGGERRLNVAVTRAKRNVKLISSILPSDIDLSRTNSAGVSMLRSYIEFAMNGAVALKTQSSEGQTEDGFVRIIGDFLEQKGFKVRYGIGCSEYKIDIGIEHPYNAGCYAAGIECDGFSYASAKTARDRDHLRSSVLKAMGWNMYRVWSTEWIKNRDIEASKLLTFVSEAISKYSHSVESAPQKETADNSLSFQDIAETVASAKALQDDEMSSPYEYGFRHYKEALWSDADIKGITNEKEKLAKVIKYIVSEEQPIARELLYRRLAGYLGNQKVTILIRRKIDGSLNRMTSALNIDQDGFISIAGTDKIQVSIPKANETPRSIEHIAPAEICEAMIAIINNTFGITAESLIDETARIYGYGRKTQKVMDAMNRSLERLITDGRVRVIDEKVKIAEDSHGKHDSYKP